MPIKVGDQVKVIAGDAKGKTGTVLKLIRTKQGRSLGENYTRVVVEGVNERQRNRKAMMGQSGQVVTIAKSIHISNVNLLKENKKENKKVSPKSKK